ncbi:hypothetical protein BDZ85DRAFT_304685 [Elsinoe ampelina]|uniref:Uncharacterized protein n=1 Tax=Elsinoe ampelina TaxID=302913 RepID=A0A6A6G1R8_9PEZI|nr:hypothetical protein BDZ85DRAFT_304685 [Elsinoe ampelina]
MSQNLMDTEPGGESDQSVPSHPIPFAPIIPLPSSSPPTTPPFISPPNTIVRYSSINTINKPHATSTGQLSTAPSDPSSAPSHSLDPTQTKPHHERGEQTAANIRYGQAISEQGMGGKTTTLSGEAGQEGGYGGTSGKGVAGTGREGEGEERERGKQGYAGGREMRGDIGA